MAYNIWFECSAIVYMAVLLVYILFQYDLRIKRNRGFLYLLLLALAGNGLDIVTAFTISDPGMVSPSFNLFLNELYYLTVGLTGLSFVHYSFTVTGWKKSRTDLLFFRLSLVLFFLFCLLLVLNIPTGLLASFTESAYIHGPLYVLIFILPYLLVLLAYVRMLFFSEEMKDRKKKALMIVNLVFCVGAAGLQMIFFPQVLLTMFAAAVGMTFLLMLMETPDYQNLLLSLQKLEEAEKKEKEKTIALSRAGKQRTGDLRGMAASVKEPAERIIAAALQIERISDGSLIRSHSSEISRNARKVLSMADAVEDLIELEDGRDAFHPSDYRCEDVLMKVKQRMLEDNTGKGLSLHLRIDPYLPAIMHGDHTRLLQVMNVLVDNAVQYTSSGGVIVSMESGSSGFSFSIEDTGKGLRQEDIPDVSSKPLGHSKEKGAGLGLLLARRILSIAGTDLKVESIPGKGSRVWFYVNQESVGEELLGKYAAARLADLSHAEQVDKTQTEEIAVPPERVMQPEIPSSSGSQKAGIAVVLSDPLEEEIFEEVLQNDFQLVSPDRASVIVSDQTDSFTSQIRTILVAKDQAEEIRALERGAFDVVRKPVVMGLLRRRIQTALEESGRQK
jgi:signal transduction histidine kinase